MYVRVDNGDGISLGIGTCYGGGDRNRPCGSRLYEFASIHFGFLLCAILSASGLNPVWTILYPSKSARSRKPDKVPHMVDPAIVRRCIAYTA